MPHLALSHSNHLATVMVTCAENALVSTLEKFLKQSSSLIKTRQLHLFKCYCSCCNNL